MDATIYSFFFRYRWPNGFVCPGCGYREYSCISTRRLPLYQCKACRLQTSLTAGTAMHGSRTPLEKWAAALQLLASTQGVNAVQLANEIGVTYKTAWGMLRALRRAIGSSEAGRPLQGTVAAGIGTFGRWFHQPFVSYKEERIILIGASVEPGNGEPFLIKLHAIPRAHLTKWKTLTRRGTEALIAKYVHKAAKLTFLTGRQMHWGSTIRERLESARRWLNRLFHGLGASSIQPFLDEYCFRFNITAGGWSPAEEWLHICLSPSRMERTTLKRAA